MKQAFPISLYGWTYWLPIAISGSLLTGVAALIAATSPEPNNLARIIAIVAGVVTFAGLAFFRDFPRPIPTDPGIMVAPADGKVTEITRLDSHPHLGHRPALKIGIFLSVLDVHVNRSPCDSVLLSSHYAEGLFLDARHPESGLKNQSNTLVLGSAQAGDHHAIAVVRQVVGAIARRIIAPVAPGQHLARGERFGMIAFGSRTELIVPNPDQWEVKVHIGQHVKGGVTIMIKQM
jgi:phosphatidylserine decarboxylase